MDRYPSARIWVPIAKLENYLLRPGAKHCAEFFAVGYDAASTFQLFRDIEAQFDESKATEHRYLPFGVVDFSIYMALGITDKKTFRTVWRRDSISPFPRLITAYRQGGGQNVS
ncbi:MAG: hypothetical protein IJ631_06355 [Schwartzia sp.]|nr:hypothetical protein [Schwartzia sp. (in: firmicutes)]